jgi:hypothetical protein
MSIYIHHVPGRLRIQIDRLKGNPRAAVSARRRMTAEKGVQEVKVTLLTGSLTMVYDRERIAPARLWQVLQEQGLVAGDPPRFAPDLATRMTLAAPRASRPVDQLVETLCGMLVDKLLERSALALVGALI